MATLLLQAAGAAVGGMIGGPLGATLGRAAGALAGNMIDNALLGDEQKTRHIEGPRLRDVDGLTSTEGAPIPRVYGRARIGGQLIWATRIEEVATTTVERARSRGGKGAPKGPKTVTTSYAYYANLAIGLCEGPIAFVRRVWADGRELDQNSFVMRVHAGHEDQAADPLIVAKEGAGNAPAYRGLAYVVFERLALEEFGNRIPQFSFEVVRPVEGLASQVRGVCLIPGASEFGYDTLYISSQKYLGATAPENRHQLTRLTNVQASLDALQAICPNVRRVALVVSWFGDDLRAGQCTIAPRVENVVKFTDGASWGVAGLDRFTARLVSQVDGKPAYGGTPSDTSVIRLIQALNARGLEVVLYPFVMMDVPSSNALTDPWTGNASQPAYPWRGRITCDPAPSRAGTVDGTAAAGTQVAAFFGSAVPDDFSVSGTGIAYSGPDEWSFRRHILHYAHLAQAAGGVHGFIIGTEMVSLTKVRSASGVYPAANALATLAGDVRAIVGAFTKITYAADWTEYGAHVLDGGAEVRFPLDVVWAHPSIDAVGIDFYPPIADWRDGAAHLDAQIARSAYDVDYLRARIAGGEAYDWYYASPSHRALQNRLPITDGAYNKPWVYRAKDIQSWWSEPHVQRMGGVETTASPWMPRSKPIWLTEIGCPAVDKGANSPNLFPDPKSTESGYPPFSRRVRDDLIQTRTLQAILSRYDASLPGHDPANNPVSPLYGGPMVDPGHVFVWAWDARPFPAFPDLAQVWADGPNWETGHWITGRVEGLTLDGLVKAVLADYDAPVPDSVTLDGFLDGYVIDRPMSAREALEPLSKLFGFDAVATGGAIRFQPRSGKAVATLTDDDVVPDKQGAHVRLKRAQETELPREVQLGFTDGEVEYRRAAVASRRLAGDSRREAKADVAAITRRAEAQRLSDIWLQDVWAGRETAEFTLSPRRIDLEVGDLVALPGAARLYRITRLEDGEGRRAAARAVEPSVYDIPAPATPRPLVSAPKLPGKPYIEVLDVPYARGEPTGLHYLAVAADPWPGRIAVWRSRDGASFDVHAFVDWPAIVGRTVTTLQPGPLWRWDTGNYVDVVLKGGALASIPDGDALGGGNTLAIKGPDGRWELLSAARAELIAEDTWRLSRLLRGLAGTEAEARRVVPTGASVVVLDEAVLPLTASLDDLGRPYLYRVGPADRDYADPAYVEFEATAGGEALKPYAPVRVKARRTGAGVEISFIRRTRTGGDAWEAVEVPLGEASEAYEVDVMDGAVVKRTLRTGEPRVVYEAADELADFGRVQAVLKVRVVQVSATVGPGMAWEVEVGVA